MAFDFNSLSTTPLSQKERLTIGTTTPQSSGAFNFNELPKSPIEIIASKLHGYGVNTPESYGLSKPAVSQTTTQWGIGIKPEQQRTNATAVTTPQVAEQIPEPKTYFEALADTVDAITEQGRKSKEQYERGEISGATKYSGDVANITSLAVAPIGELFNQVPLVGGIMRVMSEGLQFGPKGAGEALSNLPGYKQILEKNPWITDYSEAVSPTVENATITALNLATLLGTVESGIKAGVRGKTALEYRVTRDTDGKLLTRNGDGDVVYIEDKNGVPTYGEKPADYPLIRLNSALQDLKKSSGEAIENKKVAKNAETVKEIITGTKSGQNWWAQNAEADAASQRVAAKVDLSTSIDTTGTVNTKPQQEYFKQTYLDKTEATGYKLLEKEDASVNLQRISDKLVEEFGNTNLPQSIVKKAIETILRKLSTTADELGNVKLLETAKEKSAAQRSANYERTQNNTNNEIKNKTVGRALRLVVEETSKTDIAKVNGELSKLYQELAILERLDAMKVAGGKLGKYFSQISGNIVGGLAGGAVGGPAGAAAAAVVGGELASALRGRIMAGKFKSTTPKGEIGATLEKAIAETKKPKKVDLKTPDKKVGAPKTVKKTPEIVKLEAKIAKNVEAQKAAIKAKDYTLVAKLKEAYDILVTQLKKAIKYLNENGSVGMSIKKTVTPESVAKRADDADMGVLDYVIRDYDNAILDPNVNRTLSDMGLGKATREERIRFAKDVFDEQAGVGGKVTKKTDPLVEEARKYKSAEEFVADVNQTNISRLKQDQNFSFDVDAADFNQWLWKGVPRSGRKYELVYMSPDEYLNLLRTKSDIGDVPAFPNKDIANLMRGGEKMPVPWLEYDKAGKIIGQEGRNRALAAKELGIKEIPVVSEMPTSATSQLTDIWEKANRTTSATDK